jgi:hypothetical protein
MSEPKQRDWMDFADLVVKTLASIGIPLALFFSSQVIAKKQAYVEEIRQVDERATKLLSYLASEKPKERLLGVKIIRSLAQGGRVLEAAVETIALYDDDDKIKVAALAAADAQPSAKPAAGTTAQQAQATAEGSPASKAGAGLPPRLYIQIGVEEQRAAAASLERELEKQNLIVPGIERVRSAPQRSDLRYFWPEDKAEAEDIAKRLADLDTPVTVVFPEKFARQGRPRHFELWLAPPRQ